MGAPSIERRKGVERKGKKGSKAAGSKFTGLSKKLPAQFGERSYVVADGLCIGCLRLAGRMKFGGNSSMQEFSALPCRRKEERRK